jgi:hypothetical protein
LSFAPGEAYQFDWSHEVVVLSGVTVTVKVAHVRLCHSRMLFVRAYPRETREMVFDAHDRAFALFKGTCGRGIYDNMKTAVETVFVGKDRLYNRRFLQMCSHYLVDPVACTPASGWENGQVENQVGLVRERFFTPRRASLLQQIDIRQIILSLLRPAIVARLVLRAHQAVGPPVTIGRRVHIAPRIPNRAFNVTAVAFGSPENPSPAPRISQKAAQFAAIAASTSKSVLPLPVPGCLQGFSNAVLQVLDAGGAQAPQRRRILDCCNPDQLPHGRDQNAVEAVDARPSQQMVCRTGCLCLVDASECGYKIRDEARLHARSPPPRRRLTDARWIARQCLNQAGSGR